MNGFEPIRRHIIDYTDAGQWSEVFDGPLDECESEKLKAENDRLLKASEKWMGRAARFEADNAKLRELVRTMMRFFEDGDWCDTECDHARECDSQEQYEDDCLMRFVFRDRMLELGIEVNE